MTAMMARCGGPVIPGGTKVWYDRFMRRDAALQMLRNAAPELRARYGVVGARLFGSTARDEADERSDVDVAVRFSTQGPQDVMALCGISGFLSEHLGAEIDLVAEPVRNPALAVCLEHEAVLAF